MSSGEATAQHPTNTSQYGQERKKIFLQNQQKSTYWSVSWILMLLNKEGHPKPYLFSQLNEIIVTILKTDL